MPYDMKQRLARHIPTEPPFDGTNQLTDAANKGFYMPTTEMNTIIPVLVGEFKTLLQSKKRVTRDMESTTINRFIDELIKTL